MSDRYVPLRVTAHLEAGLAYAHDWGLALDGILASVVHHQAKAELLAAGGNHIPLRHQDDPVDLDLPLARCTLAGENDWHWAATCSAPADGQDLLPQVVRWSSRHDHRLTTAVTSQLPGVVDDQRGRYRSHWMPLTITLTTAVTFEAVGDLDAIRSLVTPIAAIGKKRAAGHGRVLRWEVEPTDRSPLEASHLHPDQSLGRPTPGGCLTHLHAVDPREQRQGTAGLRPPSTHTARARPLFLPAPTHADAGAA